MTNHNQFDLTVEGDVGIVSQGGHVDRSVGFVRSESLREELQRLQEHVPDEDAEIVSSAIATLDESDEEAPAGLLTGLSEAGLRIVEQLAMQALNQYLGLG